MKLLSTILLGTLLASSTGWSTDFEKAKTEAVEAKKLLLLNFSGSDWCIPCMKMKKEIFDAEVFMNYAATRLVLVHADFPRLKKNQLDKKQVQSNEELADKYNPQGKFPFTVIIDPATGNILKEFDGLPQESPEKFVEEIKITINAGK